MNLKIKIALVSLFLSAKSFSQEYPKLLIVKQDTLVVFTKKQSIHLTKINEENKTNKLIINNQHKQLQLKDSIISVHQKNFNSSVSLVDTYKELVKSKENIINAQKSKETILTSESKKYKRQRNISIVSGALLVVLSLLIK
jgi:hypothetical protein